MVEDSLVEEHQGIHGLVLGRGGDLALHGEVREECLDLRFGGEEVGAGPHTVETGEASDPLHLGVFRAETIVLGADSHTHLLQKPGRLIPWGRPVVLDHRILLLDNVRKPFVYYTYVHYNKNA